MSQSFTHDDGIEPRSGASPDGSLDEQLAAEIADHLAAAAGDLKQRGETEDEAARLALAKFGDVARVKRQCWWIHNGEEVMFRTAGIALLSLLTLGVAVVCFGGWQLQRNLAARTEKLSEQLESLTTTQQALLSQQQPPQIIGRAYLGERSKPAADVAIKIYRFPESEGGVGRTRGVTVDVVRTDAEGRFKTGALQYGDYCLLAPLRAPNGESDDALVFKMIQTKPLALVPGSGAATVDLDLLASGQIDITTSADIPDVIRFNDGTDLKIPVNLQVMAVAWSDGDLPVRSTAPNNYRGVDPIKEWPVPFDYLVKPFPASTLPRTLWLPTRTYQVHASIAFAENSDSQMPGKYFGAVYSGRPNQLQVVANKATAIKLTLPDGLVTEELKAAIPTANAGMSNFPQGSVGAVAEKMHLGLQIEPTSKVAP
jgi:hypothetical protein